MSARVRVKAVTRGAVPAVPNKALDHAKITCDEQAATAWAPIDQPNSPTTGGTCMGPSPFAATLEHGAADALDRDDASDPLPRSQRKHAPAIGHGVEFVLLARLPLLPSPP